MDKYSGRCSVSNAPSRKARSILTEDRLGEINPDAFAGELPSKKQSDYARQQNCEPLQS